LASEALAAGESWVLIKSLTEEVRLRPEKVRLIGLKPDKYVLSL